MKRKMHFTIAHLLCIVCVSSQKTTTHFPEIRGEQEEQQEGLVRNGRLLHTWSDNFTADREDLDLSNLGIEILDTTTFDKFFALNEINLSSNKLVSTKNIVNAFQRVKPSILNLSHNNLSSTAHDLPSLYDDRSYKQNKAFLFDSKYFWSIDLSHNSLTGVGMDFDVVYLNLSNNLIRCHGAIESHRFYGNRTYVGSLDLSHNLINCQNRFFTPDLDTLDMSYNKLTGLDTGLLAGLRSLTEINLNHNNIRYIHPQAFVDNFRLHRLHLQANLIRNIYKQVWLPTRHLKYIDLSGNRLGNLEWDMDTTLGRISPSPKVDVTNNTDVWWSQRSFHYFNFCGISPSTDSWTVAVASSCL